jgi:WD40 repeat protein
MRALVCQFALVSLLIVGSVSAQDAKGWLGADVQDLTKAEADKLGWDTPHGAKLGVVASGSPADKVGLKTGDMILSVDRTEIDTASELNSAIEGKPPGTEIHFRVISGGHERRVSVTLAEQPKVQTAQDQGGPLLMLDTGGHMAKIQGVAFTPDGKQLVSGADDKVVRVWDWRAGKTVRTIRGALGRGDEGKIFAMALSPDGRWLAVGGWFPGSHEESDAIRLFDFATGKLVALLKGHTNVVNSLAFSPDSKQLISGSSDDSAIIWDVEVRKPLHRLPGHTGEIYGVAFTPDGKRVVTGSYDNTARLWRVGDGGLIAELKGHKDKVFRVAINPIDGSIASASNDGEIRLWNGTTGTPVRAWMQLGSNPGSLTFSVDGTRLVTGVGSYGPAHNVHVWNVADGKEILTYTAHGNVVLATAISPDGELAATGGGYGEIHVWKVATGAPRTRPDGNPLVLAGTGAPT